MHNKLIAVVGPTATGKTSLGVHLANLFDGEIISADSRQVYRGMDLGTGKDLGEYIAEGKNIKYHLIDIADPSDEFNLFRYKKLFIESFTHITSAGKLPVMVGGTGLYISSVIQDYQLKEGDFSQANLDRLNKLSDEELISLLPDQKILHNKNDLASRERIIKAVISGSGSSVLSFKVKSCVIGVHYEREEIRKRITSRLIQRLDSGMIEEVKALIDKGISPQKLISFGLEYKYITLHLTGLLNFNDMFQKLNTSIHAFAKRQMTWFRKMEKEGVKIHWVDKGDRKQSEQIVKKFLQNEI